MARYELRRWTDSTQTEYVVRQTSDDYEAINKQYLRTLSASSEPNLNFVYDTKGSNDVLSH